MSTPAGRLPLSRRQVFLALAFGAAACDMPRDTEGALARVRSGGRLRVGATDSPPWVRIEAAAVTGIEPALIGHWATQLGAEPVWFPGAEAELFRALRQRALDVVVGGLLRDDPCAPDVAVTQVFFTTRVRLGVRPGLAVPETWEGQRVRVSKHRPSALGPVRALGAIPVADDEPAVAVAAYDFALPGLGLVAAGPTLGEEAHVIATAPGESALLFALDRFLAALGEPAVHRLAVQQAAG